MFESLSRQLSGRDSRTLLCSSAASARAVLAVAGECAPVQARASRALSDSCSSRHRLVGQTIRTRWIASLQMHWMRACRASRQALPPWASLGPFEPPLHFCVIRRVQQARILPPVLRSNAHNWERQPGRAIPPAMCLFPSRRRPLRCVMPSRPAPIAFFRTRSALLALMTTPLLRSRAI